MIELLLTFSLLAIVGGGAFLLIRHIRKLEEQLAAKAEEEVFLRNICEEAKTAKFEAEKQLELLTERYAQIEKRMLDWEKSREEAVSHAKAAIFEAGSQLSGKLLEEHKRETEESKKLSAETTKQTTAHLHQQMQTLEHHVASLKGKVDESADTVAIVKRSLLSPVGAGGLAEITLENILKASNLVKGRDFITQYTITDDGDGNRLRPDAVLFLPAGRIIIVDSKASKFFLELAHVENAEQEQEIYAKIKTTMRNHLKSLAAKDYKEAVRSQLKKLDPDYEIRHISTLMFIPSESALEKLCMADPEFQTKALEAEIIPAGPAGMVNILSITRFHIAEEQQLKNHTAILEEVRKLLASLGIMVAHAERLGKAIQSTSSHFDKFSASFNSKLLQRARSIQHLGVTAQNNKPLPAPLERHQLIVQNNATLIDAEAEELLIEDGTV